MSEDKNAIGGNLRRAIQLAEEEDYEGALPLFATVYGKESAEKAVDGLSFYGLSLAVVQRKYHDAITLCETAVARQSYFSFHYANLARVYLMAGSRKKAVTTLEQGLKRHPRDEVLIQLRDKMGFRRPNAIPFLSRDNFLNIFLGRIRHDRVRRLSPSDSGRPRDR